MDSLSTHTTASPPSPWVVRWASQLSAGSTVLDVACGSGRHVRWLAERGLRVTGLDRDAAALAGPSSLAEVLVADIEAAPWPLPGRQFDAVVVTNYLWRPLLPTLVEAVAPGGLLIYETFGAGNARFGRPSRPDFLLQPGELLQATQGLRVLGYEDGYLEPPPCLVQRICARREHTQSSDMVQEHGLPLSLEHARDVT
jgi:SAM-dependent methyltransferase